MLESIEKDEWKFISDLQEEIRGSIEYANATVTKDRRMNIRISTKDLDELKLKAVEEGMPYQTLVSSIIHKYLSGKLVERDQAAANGSMSIRARAWAVRCEGADDSRPRPSEIQQ